MLLFTTLLDDFLLQKSERHCFSVLGQKGEYVMHNQEHRNLGKDEKKNLQSLATALGIELRDLLQLNFSNQDLFNSSGVATQVKYIFSDNNPQIILNKIAGLDNWNSIILNTCSLIYYKNQPNASE